MKLYHGTCDYFDSFKIIDGIGQNTGNNGGAIFFTSDIEIAKSYSIEGFKHKHECDDIYYNDSDLLQEDAEKQAHVYSVDVDITNALELDINQVYNRDFYKKQHRKDILDAFLINHIINILQNRVFQNYFEFYDEKKDQEALEFLLPYIEEYDEELDDYIEKDFYYNCIIIKNAVDSIDDISHYIQSTIVIVLDEDIIKNKQLMEG